MRDLKSARRIEAVLEKLVGHEKANCVLLSEQIEALESSYLRLTELSTDPGAIIGGRFCVLAFTPLQRHLAGAKSAYAEALKRVQQRGGQLRLASKAAAEAEAGERAQQEHADREEVLERVSAARLG